VGLPRKPHHLNDFRAAHHGKPYRHGDHDMAGDDHDVHDRPILNQPDDAWIEYSHDVSDHNLNHACDERAEHWHQHGDEYCHAPARPVHDDQAYRAAVNAERDDDQRVTVEQLLDLEFDDHRPAGASLRAYDDAPRPVRKSFRAIASILWAIDDLAPADRDILFRRLHR
jgi:hypothetical protein